MSGWPWLYRGITTAALPFLHILLGWREDKGKEDPDRLHERFGYASAARPTGKLLWVHAASVGEMMSTLLLLEKLAAQYPRLNILVTTGTVTSARLLATRLPPRTLHQYVPLDSPECVARFMAAWQPDMALWVESELWPNMLAALRTRHLPCALVNARISERSARHWRLAAGWLREMLQTFTLCLTQTEAGQSLFTQLGAPQVAYVGNMKFGALPLPDDAYGREKLAAALGQRSLWLFSSSHAGEEEIALAAHKLLRKEFPDLLLILVPRHPARAAEISKLIAAHGFSFSQRSAGETPKPDDSVYLADTIGELGVFYRLCPHVVMGGSFVPVGGHNPIEPARLGCAVGFGPLMSNFTEVATNMLADKAAQQCADAAGIAAFIGQMLHDSDTRRRLSDNGRAFAEAQSAVQDRVLAALQPLLKQAGIA